MDQIVSAMAVDMVTDRRLQTLPRRASSSIGQSNGPFKP